MTNFFHHYSQYLYLEKTTTINELKIGGFYRLYTYKYEDTGITENYNLAKTPLLLIIGKTQKYGKMVYALKINNMPLRRFLKLYDDIQNQAYTRQLIKEIEDKTVTMSDSLDYTSGAKAILIDKTGRGFFNKTVRQSQDLERYDTIRTYKVKNIKQIKELYLDVSKLKARLGFKNFNNENETK